MSKIVAAAAEALLKAWPGWDAMPFGDGVTRLRLPLFTEARDE